VAGAILTLRDFAPGATPLRYTFPAFCLDASRNFVNVAPVSGPTLHADGDAALPVGGFVLDALDGLRLSGGFNSRRVELDFASILRLGTLLAVPVTGTVGSEGLRFGVSGTSLTLLGFDFADVSLGVTNSLGELPAVGFSGRLPSLPSPLNTLRFGGDIPAVGAFSLRPAQQVSLPSFIPAFPLEAVRPGFTYRPQPYADVVREDAPAGYWRLDDESAVAADGRRSAFVGAITPRNGEYLGAVQRGQPAVPGIDSPRAVRFDGSTAWVRLPDSVPGPSANGLSVSLWFRRASGAVPTAPQTLAGRGSQWSLQLAGSSTEGTRLRWRLDGLRDLDGAALPALASLKRFGMDDTGWHHVVAVYDGAAQWLYLDGRLDAWQPVRGSIPAADARAGLAALASASGATEYFNGWLDEVAFFPAAIGPVEVLGQWLAAGQGGLMLEGTLPANAIPGLPAVTLGGLLGGDGSLAAGFSSDQAAGFAGVRLPQFRGLVVRSGGAGAVAFQSELGLPQLDGQSLGTAQGFLGSDGRFLAEAAGFLPRRVFGWDFRLNRLLVSGNWRTPAVQADLAGDLRLPHNLATLAVSGVLDPARAQYTFVGSGSGSFNVGSLPFSITSPPKLTDQGFEVGGTLALGAAADSARFSTTLKATKAGVVDASFGGTTVWVGFGGDTHGQVQWNGRLAFVSGYPQVTWRGTLGLSWPGHPASVDDLPAGFQTQTRQDCWTDPLGNRHCVDTPVGMTLRMGETDLSLDRLGRTTLGAEPAFRGDTSFGFRLP
jgi:hypothetical protein